MTVNFLRLGHFSAIRHSNLLVSRYGFLRHTINRHIEYEKRILPLVYCYIAALVLLPPQKRLCFRFVCFFC